MNAKAEKPQGIKRTIDLDMLRSQGFSVDIEHVDGAPYEANKIILTAKSVRRGNVLDSEVAAELEMTYGVKKTNTLQKRVVRMLNELAFRDALRLATK